MNRELQELSPKSAGVEDFLQKVKDTPGLLKHLGFRTHKALQEYIADGDYEDFEDLKKDANKFKEDIKEAIEFGPPSKPIQKLFKILNSEKKKTQNKKKS